MKGEDRIFFAFANQICCRLNLLSSFRDNLGMPLDTACIARDGRCKAEGTFFAFH